MIKKLFFTFVVLFSACSVAESNTQIYGEYANGCIDGAVELKAGRNYQLQIWGKNRHYGHPEHVDFILDLVKDAKKHNLPDLLIGDMSGPVGGAFAKSSHGSHQPGLDVVISFDFATPKKTQYELTHPDDIYIVDTKNRPTSYFNQDRATLIYLAAIDPRVERIFVAPGIKKRMCQLYLDKDMDLTWLSKVRPWFGHRGHMHVRLGCPKDSPYCVKQKPNPVLEDYGCGYEVDSWIDPSIVPKSSKPKKPQVKPKKVIPKQCKILFNKKKS